MDNFRDVLEVLSYGMIVYYLIMLPRVIIRLNKLEKSLEEEILVRKSELSYLSRRLKDLKNIFYGAKL